MKFLLLRLSIFFLLLAASTQTHAQLPYTLVTEKIADNMYVFKPSTACKDIVDANCIAIIGKHAVILVDGYQRAAFIQETIKRIKAITSLPVRSIINTHSHGDHTFSNYHFKREFPSASIIAHPIAALEIDSSTIPSMKTISAGYTDVIKIFENSVKTRKRNADTLIGYEFARRQETLKDCYQIVEDYRNADPSLVRPDLLVSDTLRIDTGNDLIEIFHTPASHSKGDLVIWVPSQKILLAGDIIVSPAPYAIRSNHANWQKMLDWIQGLQPKVIVPGHGEPQRNANYIQQLSELLRLVESSSRKHFVKEMKLPDLVKKVEEDVRLLRKKFTAGEPECDYAFKAFFLNPAVRGYWEALGKE